MINEYPGYLPSKRARGYSGCLHGGAAYRILTSDTIERHEKHRVHVQPAGEANDAGGLAQDGCRLAIAD